MKKATYNFSINELVSDLLDRICEKTSRKRSDAVEDGILSLALEQGDADIRNEARRIAQAKAVLRGEKKA